MTMYNSRHSDRGMVIVSSLAFVVGCAVGFALRGVSYPPLAEMLHLVLGVIFSFVVLVLVILALGVCVMAAFILCDKAMRGEIL